MNNSEFLRLNKHLTLYKWIGGWEDWSTGECFLWRRENGKRVVKKIIGAERYFCIPNGMRAKIPSHVWNEWKKNHFYKEGRTIGNYDYFYVNGKLNKKSLNSWFRTLESYGVNPLEGDVSRLARLMIDLELMVASPDDENPPIYCYYDIETDDRTEKINIGENRILSVAIKDVFGNEYFYRLERFDDDSEREFLTNVIRKLIEYDIIIGYNSINFDDPYFESRCEKYEIKELEKWKRLCRLDVFNIYEKNFVFKNWGVENRKLDTIAKKILGRGKVEHKEKIYDLWESNSKLLEEYNLEDVRLVYELEKNMNFVEMTLGMMAYSNTLYSFGFSTYRCIDNLLLRKSEEMRRKGIFYFRYPTAFYKLENEVNVGKGALAADRRKKREEVSEENGKEYEKILGALVLDIKPGIYENVAIADFNSLYPNSIIAFNIGLDTQVEENSEFPKNRTPNGIFYRTDIKSGFSLVVSELLRKRKEIKALMAEEGDPIRRKVLDIKQYSLKVLANSFYGVLALQGGRYYNKGVAESITSVGRYFLNFAQKFFENRTRYAVIAGDTDSIFLRYPENEIPENIISEYIESLKNEIRNEFNCHNPDVFKMSVEKKASAVIFLAKKLYAMKLTEKDGKPSDDYIYKGLRIIKGNISHWSSQAGRDVINKLLEGKYNSDYFENYLLMLKRDLEQGNFDWRDFLLSQRIGKGIGEYKSEPVHVRIAKRLINSGIFIPDYATINYLVTDGSKQKIEAVEECEVSPETEIDIVYYYNREFMAFVEDCLGIVFPEIDWKKFEYPKKANKKVKVKNENFS